MKQLASRARRRRIGVTAALGVVSIVCGLPMYAADGSNQAPPAASDKDEMQELKRQVAEQQKQIEELRLLLLSQQKELEKTGKDSAASGAQPEASAASAPEAATPAAPASKTGGEVASLTPILPPVPVAAAPKATAVVPPPDPQKPGEQASTEAPLQLKIGSASITPVGFMDITNTWRSTNAGTSLQTNFGSFPYNNVAAGRLTEDKWSAENSRIGLRVDARVGGANVLGYFESDFVGGSPSNNTQVSSNSMLLRIRQYYVDVRHGFWEVLAGQAWSMLLPNRRGMSPLPADLFYTQVVDVNYTNGLYWGRIPGIRFIGHPNKKVAFGIALENSDQYLGGSGGGGVPTLPAALATAYTSQVDVANGSVNDRTLPNVHPDIIAKFTVDPTPRFHFEVAGVESTVKVFNPNTQVYFTKAGGGGAFSVHAEVIKGLRLVTNNFWSDGEGRYLFGEAPNFIIRADGSPSLLHSGSTVSGFEATMGKFAPYVYYGGIYIGRDTALDANKTSYIGYGYPGSPNSQNRSIQEITAGWTHTIWRDGRYGALQEMVQYAYFFRNPWFVAPNAPKGAHESAVWFNLRYVLPGSAPTVEY
ncbi:MAG TPA: hypothetical protein VKV74_00175 [Bryobacteraceae bacterium]|nr:hypothetical protein [Bryobacteraceae bacterium]